jgi:thiamine pyrophosphokinase
MGRTVFIISGGTINDPEFLRHKVVEAQNPVIICADGAARYLRVLDIVPAFIIGDMDSIDTDTLEYFYQRGSTILRHPGEKDETDTQLALEYAIKLQPRDIFIFGALGGRIDHTLANISLLTMGDKAGVQTRIIDETCELFIVSRSVIIEGQKGQTVSLLPLSSEVAGITLEGFEYPLSDGVMEIGRPYGISNILISEKGMISIQSGYLLVIRNFAV